MTVESSIGQRVRLIILIIYLVGLCITSWAALGSWIPPTSERGIWFFAALAALLLGSLLITPFFMKPADAISYGVAATVTLLAVNPWASPAMTGFDRFTWSSGLLYVIVVLASAILAISLKDSSQPLAQRVSRSGLLLADVAGGPRAIFSVVFFGSSPKSDQPFSEDCEGQKPFTLNECLGSPDVWRSGRVAVLGARRRPWKSR